jgi:cytochrome c-type biogenesis protein CcmH/NrfG
LLADPRRGAFAIIRPVVQRVLLIVVAVAACGWLAAGLYSSRLQTRAEHPHPGDSVADRLDRLDRAAFLNPSVELKLREAQIVLEAGDADEAVRLLREVVRREPDNRYAWAGLAQALGTTDPAGTRHALSELRRLVPPVPDAEE